MQFSHKKLAKDKISSLRRVPISVCEPSVILLTPVYVYLPKNQKFVAIKAPLEFFSKAELEKLSPFENFYLPDFIDLIAPFQRAGESVSELLKVKVRLKLASNMGPVQVELPTSQHETSDSILRLTSSLWGAGARIEPFFLIFFANEICGLLPEKVLRQAADNNLEDFELSLLQASVAVFLALQMGWSERAFLTSLRNFFFDEPRKATGDAELLIQWVQKILPHSEVRVVSLESVRESGNQMGPSALNVKLVQRLERVSQRLIPPGATTASVYGPKGIRDE